MSPTIHTDPDVGRARGHRPGDTAHVRTLVVMPAYNEEACIGQTMAEVLAAVPDAHLLVVDDGSADRTTELAERGGVDVLQLPYNLGVGGAMRAGFKYAERHGFDAVVQVDADGQHDASQIATLLAALSMGQHTDPDGPLEGADIVIGGRFGGARDYPVKGARRFAMLVLARAVSRMAGTRLTDTTSGFRAVNRKAIRLYARHYPAEYLGDTVESLVIAARSGFTIAEVPVQMRPRRGGTPSQGPAASALYLFRACLALALARIRKWPGLTPEGANTGDSRDA